jgi:carboxymethylenebutenolidase
MTTQNLVELWEEHCRYEFESRDVNATMATMVQQPYVNHVPTMTGGVGHEQLKRFYAYHFIPVNPPDLRLTLISRTVGTDTLVDEFILKFTHNTEIDWMLPGIPPTGCKVEVPMVAIIKFEDDKLVHEHIYWDQATVLVQIGLLDPLNLPIAGVETSRKVEDKSLPSNVLMKRWSESESKPL